MLPSRRGRREAVVGARANGLEPPVLWLRHALRRLERGGSLVVPALGTQRVGEEREDEREEEVLAYFLEPDDAVPKAGLCLREVSGHHLAPAPTLAVDCLAQLHAELPVQLVDVSVQLAALGGLSASQVERGHDLEQPHPGHRTVGVREQTSAELGHLGDGAVAVKRCARAHEDPFLFVARATRTARVQASLLCSPLLFGQPLSRRCDLQPYLAETRLVAEPLEHRHGTLPSARTSSSVAWPVSVCRPKRSSSARVATRRSPAS